MKVNYVTMLVFDVSKHTTRFGIYDLGDFEKKSWSYTVILLYLNNFGIMASCPERSGSLVLDFWIRRFQLCVLWD